MSFFEQTLIQSLNSAGNPITAGARPQDGSIPIGANTTSGAGDAFGKFRVSTGYSLLGAKQVFDGNSQQFVQSLVGSGTATYSANNACTNMTLTTANGDSVIRQTKMYIPYQPGKSQAVLITGVMGAIKANVRQRIGYFDANNGLFFEQDGSVLRVTRRTNVTGSPVDNQVSQASWNIDKLDGTGPSGITLDTSKAQIFVIDFQWLGVGIVKMGVAINGGIQYCHQFLNANALTGVYMSTPALPVRWEITNTGVAGSGTTMVQICCSVFSEGGFEPAGFVITENSGTTGVTATTRTPIIALRLIAAYNRATLYPEVIEFALASSGSALFEVYIGGTLTGGSYVATTGNASQVNISATSYSTTGAIKIDSSYVLGTTNRQADIVLPQGNAVLGSDVGGTSDVLVVTCSNISGTTTALSSITWREVY